ncbi:MAG: hypothetical protein AAF791_06025 [Bacteroidota bacterium]
MTNRGGRVRSLVAAHLRLAIGPLRRLAFLSLLFASVAHAQPTGAELLSDWREGWREASQGVASVTVRETLDRTVDGPRGDIEMRTEGRLRFPLDRPPQREIDRQELDGRRVTPLARRRFEARTNRAFGPAARTLLRPAPLAGRALASATAEGPAIRTQMSATPAWRIALRLPGVDGDATAWLSREPTPRLLRLRIEESVDRQARVVYEADYRRVSGLDVPTDLRTTVTLRQRRRLREYVVSLHARGTYRTPEVVRER